MKSFIKFVNKLNASMVWVAGGAILFMGIFGFYAVFMRYFIGKPPIWSYDLTSLLTGVTAFLGGGYALYKDAHVRVDIFYEKFSQKYKSLIDVTTSVFFFLIVIVLIWKGSIQVIDNYKEGIVASTGLNIAVWIKWLMVPVGAFLLLLQGIVNLINDIYILSTGSKLVDFSTEDEPTLAEGE